MKNWTSNQPHPMQKKKVEQAKTPMCEWKAKWLVVEVFVRLGVDLCFIH
jgi:hypothetical protein